MHQTSAKGGIFGIIQFRFLRLYPTPTPAIARREAVCPASRRPPKKGNDPKASSQPAEEQKYAAFLHRQP